MNKRLMLPGCILWLLGLVMSIVGMNMPDNTGNLVSVIGNILFLIGLGLVGAAWLMARRQSGNSRKE